ncbi:hypothetical protein, partial [Cryobacterium glucosi]|uniref:hypothetical protein n=1 Tax=Cryobacterium glucosi TaxID=1259175 RepID=UPI001A7F0689
VQIRKWADLMATSGQFYWPSAGSSMAAYGQLVMAADIPSPIALNVVTLLVDFPGSAEPTVRRSPRVMFIALPWQYPAKRPLSASSSGSSLRLLPQRRAASWE